MDNWHAKTVPSMGISYDSPSTSCKDYHVYLKLHVTTILEDSSLINFSFRDKLVASYRLSYLHYQQRVAYSSSLKTVTSLSWSWTLSMVRLYMRGDNTKRSRILSLPRISSTSPYCSPTRSLLAHTRQGWNKGPSILGRAVPGRTS